jgi:methionyl-tRNA formyltransferase
LNILAGDQETGITIMQMDAGLDTGAMLLTKSCAIAPSDTAQTLHDKLAVIGGAAIVEALAQISTLRAETQNNELATYAAKLSKEEAEIDWTKPAAEIARAVRAFNPYPVAYTRLDGEPLRIWAAEAVSGKGAAGQALEADKSGILVACGEGALLVTELQRAGGKRLTAEQLAGGSLKAGTRLGA